MLQTIAAKAAAEGTGSFTKLIFDKVFAPRLSRALEVFDGESKINADDFLSNFYRYIERSVEKFSSFSSVVFETNRRSLPEIYVPLTLKSLDGQISYRADHYDAEFVQKQHKVLISESAGMGKSTLLKFLFLEALNSDMIPIFVQLRRLKKGFGISELLLEELRDFTVSYSPKFIMQLLEDGGFVFFLDGYDEILAEHMEDVSTELTRFISRAGTKSHFILATRRETETGCFAEFRSFRIEPLRPEEAYELISKYDRGGDNSKGLIKTLEAGKIKGVAEFLGNPLLASLLYRSYQYKRIIPLKRPEFYWQVFDALFEAHDAKKDEGLPRVKQSGLSSSDFFTVLKYLAIVTLKRGSEYSDYDLLTALKAAGEQSGIKFEPKDLLEDLLVNVPLFSRDGIYVRWSHRSIQDYFAAVFVCEDTKGRQDQVLGKLFKSTEADYSNLLSLCFDIDPKSFRRALILPFLKEYIRFCENSYSELGAVVPLERIRERQAITFGHGYVIFPHFLDSKDPFPVARQILTKYQMDYPGEARKHIFYTLLSIDDPLDGLLVVELHYPAEWIAEILFESGSPIVTKPSPAVQSLQNDAALQLNSSLDSKKPIIVDDYPISQINSPGLFRIVNNTITTGNTLVIDYDLAKNAIQEIEAEVKSYEGGNFILDSI